MNELKSKAGKLTISADSEFINRKDCLIGLNEYGINFKDVVPCNVNDRYAALETNEADVFVGYESDPQLLKQEVVALKDEDQFFPRYLAQPVVSNQLLTLLPNIRDALAILKSCMDTDKLNNVVSKIANANFDPKRAEAEAKEVFAHALSRRIN